MKNLIACVAFFALPTLFSACSTENDNGAADAVVGTYVGVMNIQTSAFQNAAFTVVVEKVSSQVVRIKPTGTGTTWTATLTNISGVYTCITCATTNQVSFTTVSGVLNLTYNYGNNEQFSGIHQ